MQRTKRRRAPIGRIAALSVKRQRALMRLVPVDPGNRIQRCMALCRQFSLGHQFNAACLCAFEQAQAFDDGCHGFIPPSRHNAAEACIDRAAKPLWSIKMPQKRFTSGSIRFANYNEGEQELELNFSNGTLRLYRSVPRAVWDRLCAAPNPASYWEDRIAEEYPERKASAASKPAARHQLDALFGDARSGGKGGDHDER
ncbi:MAG: KTSC domain-containing protein [Betaproteobacteria bacterium]|nr:KTSC domain-containing protein [Betaproteobacteria bacterium]NCV89303.1 KTSC domain-containing protein [Betaproteobacteria bacterium]NCW99635.1 KTSC domain-containing protein [Betaproteobacteria bacterium]NDA72706.1 KTSC domain-containing protein [Betaproteobacteria bacterium]